MEFSVARGRFERLAARLGIPPGELAEELKARVERAGGGFRYVISMENFFAYVLAHLAPRGPRGAADLEAFEEALNAAVSRLAGATGYARLWEVKEAVTAELGISEAQFVEMLEALLKARRGAYLLLEGGDVKLAVGGRRYGYIKAVRPT